MGMDKQEIKNRLCQALDACPHKEAITSLAIFGSYVNGMPDENSDLDILVDFEPDAKIGYFAMAHIKRFFESVLGITVDLLTPPAISKYFRDEVLKQAEYLYEK